MGTPTRRCEIAILGGGIAGLVAAYKLADRDVVLLEAEEKLGGRIVSGHLPTGEYYNLGANYLSDDKVAMWDLVGELGVETLPYDLGLDLEPVEIFKNWGIPFGITVDDDDVGEFNAVWERICREKSNPRPLTVHELDGVTAQGWLGGALRPNVYLFLNVFTYLMCNGDLSEISVVGFLWAWGHQRTSPWSDEKYWRSSGRGEGIVEGGTGRIADELGGILGPKAQTSARVRRVESSQHGSVVAYDTADGTQQLECAQVVSALPAPVVLDVFSDLPAWKRAALDAVHYGRLLVVPIVVSAPGVECEPFESLPFRREFGTDWIYPRPYQMSPAPLDEAGGFFTCIAFDADARRIWDDDDDSIKSGVIHVFTTLYPELERRIRYVGMKRWENAIPQMRVGYMGRIADLEKPVGNTVFCGDYTHQLAHTDSAARSALRAVSELNATK